MWIVYALPHEMYVGITTNSVKRMSYHRRQRRRNTDDWFILHVAISKQEALRVEAEHHFSGWKGRGSRKLSLDQIEEIRKSNKPQAEIAKEYNITQSMVSRIVNKNRTII